MTGDHELTGQDLADHGQGAGDVDLGRVWLGVAAEGWRRRPGAPERVAGRLLRSPGLARALVVTPSLLLGWIIATVIVLAAGMLATLGTGTPYVALLAPAVAGAGIAYAYGPGIDPAWELSKSLAVSDRMVLLVRALAVFGLNAALGLAAATVTRSASVGVAAGVAGWVITVLIGKSTAGQLTTVITDSALVLPYLAFAACCGAITWYATRIPRGTT